ncbi:MULTISPECIES: entry exclusion protein TrbK [unclassified Rhizobium]|uniref:entry exclusion protein TrbK n=1 Tax=unclassified Rhizobium TaxID=2613769 RepID=UPI001ADB17E5|nr:MULTISPECIES: entry exclusion protein TrbK [unclassified Rhizobium]MBO9101923.1 entry exclusion protein TrbK [Rhizobium sp. L58/93]MBO9172094.1 entry exclusion protein TrbK [Rhizobium sp. L245/93]QXZ88312.1 entry exclusion protein TrbK [Rhizobium sp. K1/93]QXZ94283.1 entry exclusion protein TrbK [Rhizobium sp. K15/93]QYA05628.1 entry exclusion protein TrbK [Rhizobium sp. B21/90]
MSPRLVFILTVVSIATLAAGVTWIVVQPGPHPVSGAGEASDAARREHREKFFGGDTDSDIRGGQEMKPRW